MPTYALLGGQHIHAPAFVQKLSDTEQAKVKYVWDRDEQVAQARQAVCGGEIIADYQQALDDADVDAVVICSRTIEHHALVTAAAKAGKAMFVEKPLGMDGKEARQLATLIEETGVLFQTGYFMRGKAEIRLLKKWIQEGQLGKITRLRLSNCHQGSLAGWFDKDWHWMAEPDQAGCGAFGDLGTHVLDLLLWLMGDDKITSCTAAIQKVTGRYGECDESGEGMIRFASGAVATLAAGWVDWDDPNRLEISGTQGHARLSQGKLLVKTEDAQEAVEIDPLDEGYQDWPHAFDLFLQAMAGQSEGELVTASEAARRNEVMQTLYEAAEQGVWIDSA